MNKLKSFGKLNDFFAESYNMKLIELFGNLHLLLMKMGEKHRLSTVSSVEKKKNLIFETLINGKAKLSLTTVYTGAPICL